MSTPHGPYAYREREHAETSGDYVRVDAELWKCSTRAGVDMGMDLDMDSGEGQGRLEGPFINVR